MKRLMKKNNFRCISLLAVFVAFAIPTWGQVINEDLKLLPNDGAMDDQFGWSIAIDNGIIAVGKIFGNDNGPESGSAYLFDAVTGAQLFKLLPNDGAAFDRFGSSIAIDNGIVAVGAYEDDDNGFASGSAYLFDAATGKQLAKLLPNDGAGNDNFGWSIDIDNGIVAIGARLDNDNGSISGSAYLFDAATGKQMAKLLPSDGAAGDQFGDSIAINKNIVAVGATFNSDNGLSSGSAYLFNANSGAQIAKLLPNDGQDHNNFGNSIAINNNVVAVGAVRDDDNGFDSGSAYLFDAATGAQLFKLLPSNGGIPGGFFGFSISINSGVVVVGERGGPGSAYMYDAVSGTQIAQLLQSDAGTDDQFGFSISIDKGIIAVGARGSNTIHGLDAGSAYVFDTNLIFTEHKILPGDGGPFQLFGTSIATDNGLVAVGAPNDHDNGSGSGSAYLFDAVTGTQNFKLLANDGEVVDLFGWSVAIDNGIVAVGAKFDDDNGVDSGSAYLFDASTGTQLLKLLPSDGAMNDWFGYSIAIDNGIVVVGVVGDDDNGSISGSVYLFDASTGIQTAKLLPNDGKTNDNFGWSVSIDKGIVAVGTPFDGDNGLNSGSAYLFDASTGVQISKLLANDGAQGDLFGKSVAIKNNIVAVGASSDDDNGVDAGSAYLFNVTTGLEFAKILPHDGAAGDGFGLSVDLDAGIVAVGSFRDDDNGIDSGSTYLFNAITGLQLDKILPSDGAAGDEFGLPLSIDAGFLAVAAIGDADNGDRSGSAYTFTISNFGNCLDLIVDNLIAGQTAVFTITGGTPGSRAVTVYGTKAGQTLVNDVSGYCATFGIKGVTKLKVLGGLNRIFDSNYEITFTKNIPTNRKGVRVFFQSAMQGTCPDECMSNLVEMTVQ